MEPLSTECQCACAECGHVIDYRSTQVGEIVECPSCGVQSQLPEPPRLGMIEIFGPPIPRTKNCTVCGFEYNFFATTCPDCDDSRKRNQQYKRILLISFVVALLAVAGFAAYRSVKAALERERQAAAAAAEADAKKKATNAPHSYMMIAAPVRASKATNDFRAGKFAFEQGHGSDFGVAVGDILNISGRMHDHIRADIDVLDKSGAKIGSVSDYFNELGPRQSWHVVVSITVSNAAGVRLAGVVDDK